MVSSLIARTFIEFNECNLSLVHTCRKAYFPLGEFVRANKQKSGNSRGEFFRQPISTNHVCRMLVSASRRANKVAK